jgi:O-antigen ligase
VDSVTSVAARSTLGVALEALYLGLLVFLPAVVNPVGALAFEPLKSSLLRLTALALALLWLARRALCPIHVRSLHDLVAPPVVRAALALTVVVGVSSALSMEPQLSVLGSFDRGMGWFTLLAGVALLVVGADLFADAARRERAIDAMLLGSIVPCAYAVIQRVGLDPMSWTALGAPGSTLGSPTFLGGYLVLLAPLAMYRVLCSAGSLGSAAGMRTSIAYGGWLALLLVMVAVLLQTAVRGPLVALAAAGLAFAFASADRPRLGRREVLGMVALLAVAIALAVSATGFHGVEGLQRFARIAQESDSSVERLTVWRDALQLPTRDWLRAAVGFGPETQAAVFETAEATIRGGQTQQWDRAHSLLLDMFLTSGVLGVVALVGVFAAGLWSAWQARGNAAGERRLLAAAAFASLVGHLVEASFAFETVVTAALASVVLGIVASLSLSPSGADTEGGAGVARPWLAPLLACVGIALAPVLAAPAVADTLYGAAQRSSDRVVAAHQEEAAAAWVPWLEEPIRAAGLSWNQMGDPSFDHAEADLTEAARRAPYAPTPRLRLLRLYLGHSQLDEAEAACQRAIANGPYRASVWNACAEVSGRRGLLDEAALRRTRGDELTHLR